MNKFQAVIALTGLRKLSRHEADRTFDYEAAFMSASAFVRLLAFRAMYGVVLMTLIVLFGGVLPARAQESSETAKQAQNPIANLISVPLESDFNPQTGIHKDDSYVLEMKPVVPFRLSNDWTLITRTIIPVIQVPDLAPGVNGTSGLGDVQESLFLSPAKAGRVIWGAGPAISFPTATQSILGTKKLSIGPNVVVLRSQGHWLFGTLAKSVLCRGTVFPARCKPDAATTIRQLQPAARMVSNLIAHYYRELGIKARPKMDGAGRWGSRKDHPSRKAARKCLYAIVPKCGAPGRHNTLVRKVQHAVSLPEEEVKKPVRQGRLVLSIGT